MFRNKLMAGLAVLALLGTIVGCGGDTGESNEAATTLTLGGYVTVDAYHYDEATGTYIQFYHDEGSNTITLIGIDWIAQQLGGSPSTPAIYVSLSYDTTVTPPATWEQLGGGLDNEIFTTGSLDRATGLYDHTDGIGENTYTVVAEFTADGGYTEVQQTGLQWSSVAGSDTNLLAARHFTPVTLVLNDTLTITWTITLS